MLQLYNIIIYFVSTTLYNTLQHLAVVNGSCGSEYYYSIHTCTCNLVIIINCEIKSNYLLYALLSLFI